jgi:TolB-like protein
MVTTLALLALAAAGAEPAPKAEKPKLIVLDLAAGGGVDPSIATALTEAITQEVADRGFFQVLSSKEVQTMIGFERQKQMAGCSAETDCLTELGGALGARFVMGGTVTKLGDAYQLSLQTLDSKRAQPVGRATRLANDIKALRQAVPFLVAEATGTPLPPPPSRLVPYALVGGGALALIAGGLVGVNAIAEEDGVNRELARGTQPGTVIEPLSTYQQESRTIALKKTLALGIGVAGVGLVAAGVYLNPPEDGRPGGVAVRVVPSGPGVAVVGVWP